MHTYVLYHTWCLGNVVSYHSLQAPNFLIQRHPLELSPSPLSIILTPNHNTFPSPVPPPHLTRPTTSSLSLLSPFSTSKLLQCPLLLYTTYTFTAATLHDATHPLLQVQYTIIQGHYGREESSLTFKPPFCISLTR